MINFFCLRKKHPPQKTIVNPLRNYLFLENCFFFLKGTEDPLRKKSIYHTTRPKGGYIQNRGIGNRISNGIWIGNKINTEPNKKK